MTTLNRRTFLKAGAGLAAAGASATLSACASVQVAPGVPGIETLFAAGARVMWIAAHPDDEGMVGSLLARSSLVYRNPLYFLLMTRGDGGECCIEGGCNPDLATVRAGEMQRAAALYQATLEQHDYFNAPLPVESFPTRQEMAAIWTKHRDPVLVMATAIRRFQPTVVFTFDPHNGFTGHPEHQLTSRFADRGIVLAADTDADFDGLPAHRVSHKYHLLNRSGLFRFIGRADPAPVHELWDANTPCIQGLSCLAVMGEFTRQHQSQDRDMESIRNHPGVFETVFLQHHDPFTQTLDPFEPA